MPTEQLSIDFTATEEVWKPVVGWEGIYSVSNLGRVRRDVPGKFSPKNQITILKPKTSSPRPHVCLRHGDRRQYRLIHHLVMEAFVGPRPPGYEVNEKDCDPLNNRLDNLEYVTPLENTRHAIRMGRIKLGSQRRGTKVTEEQVMEIRRLARAGWSQRKIAKVFPIGQQNISHIVRRNTWRHV